MSAHLLHFRISHYNEKVRWALDHKGWPHTRESLVPGLHIARVRWLTGQPQLPVLVLDGKPMHGSAAILEELERRQPEPRLFPTDPVVRARAMEVQRYFDEQVAPEVRRLVWSAYLPRKDFAVPMITQGASRGVETIVRMLYPVLRPAFAQNVGLSEVQAARARLPEHLTWLVRAIGPSGYLAGESFSVADLTAAAVMTAVLRPKEFPYPLPEPWPPELVAERDAIADHPAAKWVYEIYRRHRGSSAETVIKH